MPDFPGAGRSGEEGKHPGGCFLVLTHQPRGVGARKMDCRAKKQDAPEKKVNTPGEVFSGFSRHPGGGGARIWKQGGRREEKGEREGERK